MNPDLQSRLFSALFGAPLVNNSIRGILVEGIVALVLEPEWRWCSSDWASHDFERDDGRRLEVKQSAALQSWHEQGAKPNRGSFDIRARKGRYEGPRWIAEPGRAADIYIFAWHPVIDPSEADHREAAQWRFHIVRAVNLPDQKSIALSKVEKLSEHCGIEAVASQVSELLR